MNMANEVWLNLMIVVIMLIYNCFNQLYNHLVLQQQYVTQSVVIQHIMNSEIEEIEIEVSQQTITR